MWCAGVVVLWRPDVHVITDCIDSLNLIKIMPGDKDCPSLFPPIHNTIFTDIFTGLSEISLCPPPSPLVSSLSPNPTSNRSLLLDCYLLDHHLHPPFYVPLPLFPCYYTLNSPQELHPAQWPSEVLARIPVPDCTGNPTTPVRLSWLSGLLPLPLCLYLCCTNLLIPSNIFNHSSYTPPTWYHLTQTLSGCVPHQ